MPAMARWWSGLVLLVWAACGGPPPEPAGDDVLELELGGAHQPLEAALRANDPRAPAPIEAPPRVEPEPRLQPLAPEPPAARPRTVTLRRNQTIAGLAREHLGSSSRFQEILDLNGWTEADARRLPVGTPVKIPAR